MKVALIENFGLDFYGARLRYALFLKEKGHEVVAIIPDDGYADKIRSYGILVITIDIKIHTRNLKTVRSYYKELKSIFKKEKFDVIHLYRMQPNLIGTSASYFHSKDSKIINHITGLGVAFTQTSFKYKIMQFVITTAYKLNYKLFNATLVFQNEEDKVELGNKDKYLVVKGSAVNEDRFKLNVVPGEAIKKELNKKHVLQNDTTLLFVSRLLKQKGLAYLVEAVQLYNESASVEKKFNLIVAGWIDPNNPESFTNKEIETFSKVEGVIFLGKRSDVDQLLSISDIAVLPTFYREGTPRFLLEAMAMGKPIITTDMPGCNHLIKDDENGVLIEPKSTEHLVEAFGILSDKNLKEMGAKSKLIYDNEFSEAIVFNQLLDVYAG